MNSKLSRRDDQRLSDIAAAAEAIAEHVSLLDSDEIPESVLIDAIKYNLVSIGEQQTMSARRSRSSTATLSGPR